MMMSAEEWRSIAGYESLYEVSSLGRVRSLDRIVSTYSARAGRSALLHRKGAILTQSVGPRGYMLVCLSKDGVAKTRRVNVLVCTAFHGPKPDGQQACHNDGNNQANRADNLRWDTPKANQADRVVHGTALRGEAIATAKLTAGDIVLIRAAKSYRDVEGVPVSRTHFHRIRKGEAWAHI